MRKICKYIYINGTRQDEDEACLTALPSQSYVICDISSQSQSYVYTVLYTIYCILPMPFGHPSLTYFYVHILIYSFTLVCKVVVVKLLDYLLDITVWSELEAQAFRYTRINIY